MGLESPQPGQVVRLENQDSQSASGMAMASVSTVAVVSAQ
jgi:hypothetical protein